MGRDHDPNSLVVTTQMMPDGDLTPTRRLKAARDMALQQGRTPILFHLHPDAWREFASELRVPLETEARLEQWLAAGGKVSYRGIEVIEDQSLELGQVRVGTKPLAPRCSDAIEVEAVLYEAGVPDRNGNVYSAAALERLAASESYYSFEDGKLMFRRSWKKPAD